MAWTRPGDAGNMPRPRVPLPPFQSSHDIRNFGPCRARLYTRLGRVFTRDSDASLHETRTRLYKRLGRFFTRDSDASLHEIRIHTRRSNTRIAMQQGIPTNRRPQAAGPTWTAPLQGPPNPQNALLGGGDRDTILIHDTVKAGLKYLTGQ
jgi:hypothetical protein